MQANALTFSGHMPAYHYIRFTSQPFLIQSIRDLSLPTYKLNSE